MNAVEPWLLEDTRIVGHELRMLIEMDDTVYRSLLFTETGFGLLANLFVILAVACSGKMRRSAMNLLIANLALSDFLLLFYGATVYSYAILNHTAFNPGLYVTTSWTCPVLIFCSDVCWTAAINTFVAIAVERCSLTSRSSRLVIAKVTWHTPGTLSPCIH